METSGMYRERHLEPAKHRKFLSHSGSEKNFVEHLCEDLERVHRFPFFDKRADSLPKGNEVPSLISKAARKCELAIVVLSEESFTRSGWPMLELNEFVEAQESTNSALKILPLYSGISLRQFKGASRRGGWLDVWRTWADNDDKINVVEWLHSVERLSEIYGDGV